MLQETLLQLLQMNDSLKQGKHDALTLQLLQEMDAAGLVDWHAAKFDQQPFLHALCQKRARADVLDWALREHGPGLMKLRNAQGQELMDVVLAAFLAGQEKGADKDYTAGAKIQALVTLIQLAPLPYLHSRDQPGDAPGTGWFQRLTQTNNKDVLDALARRDIGVSNDLHRLKQSLSRLDEARFAQLIEEGVDLNASMPIEPGLNRPLWAYALDRGLKLPSSPEPSPLARAWSRLRQGLETNLPSMKEYLQELPQKGATEDDLGRLAAWFASRRNSLMLREAPKGCPDFWTHRDRWGRGPWFHLYGLLVDGSWDSIKWGDKVPRDLPYPSHEHCHDRGLIAQWYAAEGQRGRRTAVVSPFAGREMSLSDQKESRARHLASGTGIWTMSPEDALRVRDTWTATPIENLNGLVTTYLSLASNLDHKKSVGWASRSASEPASFCPWEDLAAVHPAWPHLRAPMAMMIWRHWQHEQTKNQNRGWGGGVSIFMTNHAQNALENLIELPWTPWADFEVAAWERLVDQVTGTGEAVEKLKWWGQQVGQKQQVVNRTLNLQDIEAKIAAEAPATPPAGPRRMRSRS